MPATAIERKTIGDATIRLVKGDITELEVDAFVFYAQDDLALGSGVGGAMSMSEYTPRRLKSGAIKANQLKATGAEVVVTSCHNCVDGLTDVIRYYKLGMEVTQLVHLVANALVIE